MGREKEMRRGEIERGQKKTGGERKGEIERKGRERGGGEEDRKGNKRENEGRR